MNNYLKELKEIEKDFLKKHVSEWMFEDGNNMLMWKNRAPEVGEVLEVLESVARKMYELGKKENK